MKKQVTLLSLSVFALGVGTGYGQISQNGDLPTKSSVKALRTNFSASDVKTITNNNPEKAGGDTVWVDHFNTPANWTQGGTSPDFTVNGWSIGTVTNDWFFAAGNMGTSGNFARLVNGDPTATPSTEIPGPFTLTYNSGIDLTGVPGAFLEFEQYGAHFVTQQQIQISFDGGTIWDTVSTNNDIPTLVQGGGGRYDKPMTRRFFIGDKVAAVIAGGGVVNDTRIRLYWDGDMNGGSMSYVEYAWYVDNVRIMEGYNNDMTMKYSFSETGAQGSQYSMFPKGQISAASTTSFIGIVRNVGANSQDAVLNVVDGVAYNGTSVTPNTMATGVEDTVYIADASVVYAIPSTTGTYDFTFTAQSNSGTLENVADDNSTLSFQVTDSIMAADAYDGTAASMQGSFTGWANPTGDGGIGNYFEIFNNTKMSFVDIGIANVDSSYAAQNAMLNNQLLATIYKDDGTGNLVSIGTSLERTVTASDLGKMVRVKFYPAIDLQAGDALVVTASYYNGAVVPIGLSGVIPKGNLIGYDGTTFYGLISDDGYTNLAPIVRLNFSKDYTGIEENTAPSFAVYSVENGLNVDLSSTELKGATIQVVSMDGKVIAKQALTSNQMNTINVNVPTGIYFYAISNDSNSYQGKVFIK